MVSLLKKILLVSLVALYAGLSGAVSLDINDSGTWRNIDEVYVNDSGTWRAVEQIQHNDGGVWRTSYQAEITFVTVGSSGSQFYGWANPFYSPVTGSAINDDDIVMPGIGTIIVVLDDNTNNRFQLQICTSAALTQTSFSKLIIYDSVATSYVEFPTSSATTFTSNLNVTSNCTLLPADSGSMDIYEWRWVSSDYWSPADVGENRKILLVR